ncbi:GNAT family N-acetyltransferase [Streptomyces sp. TLI_146]|uniref:GNAT family N-acetyltransferase n=1 Tax=Streptomyces sp. TLI_146 TaxID=1938858 RepID=UPI000C712D15|nr:GNAT family N-acetyltransferase [Streptomyces sp. TLI_146]PKV76993.1 CelD/BcsL family acetyltransferase involved in cellulose biosynthesis [Streptomyces sp. TLI_146]
MTTVVSHTAALVGEVCTDTGRFAALADEWRRLHGRCRTATPFQSHAWLHSWWTSYGVSGRLRVVLVRRGGELVAAAPLMLVFRPFRTLVPLGGPISDFTDVLLDDDCAREAARALAAAVRAAAGGALVDLREVRPGGAAQQLHELWPGARACLADSACLELPAAPLEDLLTRLPAKPAQRVRAKLRKIDVLGVTERQVPPEEVEKTLTSLLALHRLQWSGRGVTPEHVRPRFAEHLTRAVCLMTAQGEAALTEFVLDGEVVAVDLTLQSPSLAGGYLYGAHPALRARKVDVAALLMRAATRRLDGTGRTVLSLLRGDEPYKHHWRPDTLHNQRFLLARGTRAAPLLWWCAGYARGRRWAARYVRRWRDGGR